MKPIRQTTEPKTDWFGLSLIVIFIVAIVAPLFLPWIFRCK